MSKKVVTTVRKFFPQVEVVKDATEPLHVEVTQHDASVSKRKKHSECAMAVACKRSKNLDGVIVSASMAYLVKGKTAVRYSLPQSVAREVISFDRGGGFAPGSYALRKPNHELSKGTHHQVGPNMRRKHHIKHHFTSGIRTVLGAKDIA